MKTYPDKTFEVSTLLNGALIDIVMGIDSDWDGDTHIYLWAVMFEGVDVCPILTRETIDALESEGLAYMSDWAFEQSNRCDI